MKLVSFLNQGQPSCGVVSGDDVWDLAPILGAKSADIKSLLEQGLMEAARDAVRTHRPTLKLSQLTLLPVIPNPGKIVCVGLNYAEHVRETGRETTESPALFIRFPESQVAHGQDIVRPPESVRLDYEGEIAIVIGMGGRRIREEDAWDHIAGYSCYNDGSIRDWQAATRQWTAGKNFWRTGGFGPWLVTSDEIEPNRVMTLMTRLNGQEMQRTTTDLMIHTIPRQIAYISTVIALSPGDVIVTGTPGGVGNKRTPPVYMKPGDTVEVEVDAIGILRNGIVDEA